MLLDRGRLDRLIPLTQLVTPQLLRPHFLRALQPRWDLVLREAGRSPVGETVDVPDLARADHHPVETPVLRDAPRERLGVKLRPIPRDRARKVDGINRPASGARDGELQVAGACGCGHD